MKKAGCSVLAYGILASALSLALVSVSAQAAGGMGTEAMAKLCKAQYANGLGDGLYTSSVYRPSEILGLVNKNPGCAGISNPRDSLLGRLIPCEGGKNPRYDAKEGKCAVNQNLCDSTADGELYPVDRTFVVFWEAGNPSHVECKQD